MIDRIFPPLPENGQLLDLFRLFPHTIPPLLDYHDRLLRDSSPLTVAERELIAGYVSALNACSFCHGAHANAASAYGIGEGLIDGLLEDIDPAPVDERLKPLLLYVTKLTKTPALVEPTDARRVHDAGWSEQALFEAISVCALFNMMNRIVSGSGIVMDPRMRAADEVDARRRRMGSPGPDPHRAERSYGKLAGWLQATPSPRDGAAPI